MFRAIALLLLTFPFLCSASTESAEPRQMMVAFLHFPPFMYDPKRTTPDVPGATMERFDIILKQMNIPYRTSFMPPKRIFAMAKQGQIDLIAGVNFWLATFNENMHCSKPVRKLSPTLYQRDHLPVLSSVKDLHNQKILVQRQSKDFLEKLLPEDNEYIPLRAKVYFAWFRHDRADYLIDYEERMSRIIRAENKVNPIGIRRYPITQVDAHVCVNKDYPDSQNIMHKLEEFFLTHPKTEEGKALDAKYDYYPLEHLDNNVE